MEVVHKSKISTANRKRKHNITPNEYFTKLKSQAGIIQTAQSNIRKLDAQYIKEHCPITIGQRIKVPEDVQRGYIHFIVAAIRTDIADKKDDSGQPLRGEYTIGFEFSGQFIAEGKEPMEGRIKFKNEPKP